MKPETRSKAIANLVDMVDNLDKYALLQSKLQRATQGRRAQILLSLKAAVEGDDDLLCRVGKDVIDSVVRGVAQYYPAGWAGVDLELWYRRFRTTHEEHSNER